MRRWLSLLLAVCLGLSLAGCGWEEDPALSPEPTPSPTPSPTRAPEAMGFSLGYDPSASLHPITGDSQVNQDLTGLVYQGLYELDNEFTPHPVLAASGAPSGDGYSWTFTMRAGAVFSDGTPLTAQHAAASLNAARSSALYAARLSGVTGVSAADEATLAVYLSAPNGNLPALLDVPIVLEREEGPAPLGTGCYRYELAGDRLFLETNPHHAGGAALPWSTVPLTAVTSADERIAAFDSGDITAVTTDFTDPYALGYSSSYETSDFPTTVMLYVGFQTGSGPCQSNLVRQAFSRAFDREALVQAELSGHGDAASLPLSPACAGYDREAAALLDYDLEQAAALLAQAGYERNEEDGLLYRRRGPLEVTLAVNSDNECRQAVAAALVRSLEELGASVTVSTLPWEGYLSALAQGKFDLYLGEVRLTGDFDPSPLLAGALNYGGYAGWETAQALSAWKGAQGEGREEAAQALWARFVQDAPIAPLCFKRGSLLVRWGMASNLQPTRANPFYRIEEWSTASSR